MKSDLFRLRLYVGRLACAGCLSLYFAAAGDVLELTNGEIAMGANLVPIVTSGYTQAGAKSIGKTARGAAAGAAIGAIADGGDGAAKGAAIGAVASGARRGQAVTITPGTLLEFQLQQPLTVAAAR
jgi:hypothetical protein